MHLGISWTLHVRRVLFHFGIIEKAIKNLNLKIIGNKIYLGLFLENQISTSSL